MRSLKSRHLEMLVVIVEHNKASKVLHLADEKGITASVAMLGRGTASRTIFDYLGLNDKKKAVLMLFGKTEEIMDLADYLVEKLEMDKPNHGIAYIESAFNVFGTEDNANGSENIKRGENMYNAIYTIVEKGNADDVIEAAQKAGSRGGTVMHARGSGSEEARKVFNMLIEPEKEIVLIISEEAKTKDIVESIRKETQIEEEGKGIIFITRVEQTYGLVK
ncbi:MAG: P-II family nitrogen regulator [Eubacteriales bacterium]|uniref:P-II family nitrogen regulator n=1 Tax=Fenollaria sp. TaxID=1965292 RepID=UPI002A74FB70|nr:P-II family nitrogen regulator [Fenollaria sp.]MDD7339365.1 P-II family nitrogen regulator [Eubacteriales bacterium]MDY3106122.1 P-II family nitrogen regulator [Fenollaria sp.]